MNTPATVVQQAQVAAQERPPARVNGEVQSQAKVNILLVDDRADKLLAIEAILSPLGQNLVQAKSGKEALRHLLKQDFAAILLDVSMPGMDGFETAAMIRKRPRSEHTPIIFVTSIGNSDASIHQGYSLGAVDYILTPVVPDVLRGKVSVFVELHKKTELIRHQAEQLRLLQENKHRAEMAEAEDRLEAETKRNRFFTLALELLGIAEFDGRLIQVNPTWEKTLGYTPDELKAVSILDLVHPEDREHMRQQVENLKTGESMPYCEWRCRHKYGSYLWIGWTAAPFVSEQLIYIFGRDITARRAAEGEIKKLNAELEHRVRDLVDINQELESFSYSISHDLRAPLRSISSFAQVVRVQSEANLKPEALGYLKRVEGAAKYMDNLLMGLLEYSRLSRDKLEFSPVNLDCAVDEVLGSIEQEVKSSGAEIHVARPLGHVISHVATIRQVLFNLIANAIKFVAPNQRPKIRIWTERCGDNIRMSISDQGIGIATQYHRQIFGLFQRLHPQDTYPGTGVGLAVVRKGIERMGGEIGLESKPGEGSRFWFELRAASPAAG